MRNSSEVKKQFRQNSRKGNPRRDGDGASCHGECPHCRSEEHSQELQLFLGLRLGLSVPEKDGNVGGCGLGCFSVKSIIIWCLKVGAVDEATDLCNLLTRVLAATCIPDR